MDQQRKAQSGFTLIELMIVIMVTTIMVTPLLYLEVYSHERVYTSIYRQEMAEAGAIALDLIGRDFRASRSTLESFREHRLAPDCLVLQGTDNGVIVYQLDQKQRKLFRYAYPAAAAQAQPGRMMLCDYAAGFTVTPDDLKANIITVRLDLSRPMIHYENGLSIGGTVSRRVK